MEKENNSKIFTLLVVGDNPDELIKKFDANLEVEPYIKYKYSDAAKYRKKAIKVVQDVIDNVDKLELTPFMVNYFKEKVAALKKLTDFEYYTSICDGCSFDRDGNAISTENPNGKWSTCRVGRNLCIPFKLKNGSECLQAKAGDVNWGEMHLAPSAIHTYATAWQLFHKEKEPVTEVEKQIYGNIKNQKRYFEGFDSQEDYVNYCCSYWCYAYLDENGWQDANDHKDYKWITEFYDKFVKSLKPDAQITVYECTAIRGMDEPLV